MGETGTASAAAIVIGGSFDITNPGAIEWARRESAALIENISDQQRLGIRGVIARATEGQYTPDAAAGQLRGTIGLDRQREAALAKFSAETEAGVMETITVTPRMSATRREALRERAARRIERYRWKLLTRRARTIARFDTMSAADQGSLESWTQAIARGQLSPELAKKWSVTRDDRLCEYCRPLVGVLARLDAAFVSALGSVQRPPLHVGCRSTLTLVRPAKVRAVDGRPREGRRLVERRARPSCG